jgi:predicted TPR repeat methyltransferase
MPTHKWAVFTIWIALLFSSTFCLDVDSPEALFHKTVSTWQSKASQNDWAPWNNFCDELWKRFDISVEGTTNARLEVVGALEEGILVIERIVFQQGQGPNPARDAALSRLYTTYAKCLMNVKASECLSLALDPHTLLIGADTVDRNNPDTHICSENAENSLRNALSLDATNDEANRLITLLTGHDNAVHKRKPKEFVAELFDSFADSFDDKLLRSLEYKVPVLVGELAKTLSPNYDAVLDAGCGTGLAGRYLHSLLRPKGVMIGVDASQKMLDKAATCTVSSGCGLPIQIESDPNSSLLYHRLVRADLEDLSMESFRLDGELVTLDSFDLIVAADVLVYFGTLENILPTFASLSKNHGRLIFSCELATDEEAPLGWRLLPSGRFAHTKKHAVETAKAAGYQLIFYREITPRIEKGQPVPGHLFAFELNRCTGNGEL